MDDRGGVNFILGMFVGAVVGAAVAILIAPQSGEETREQLRESADRMRDKLEKYGKDFRDDAEEFVEKGQRYMDEKYREVKAALARKVQSVKNSAEDIKEAVEGEIEELG